MTKRVVLAGGSGFLGQVLSDWLVAHEAEVVVLTRAGQGGVEGVPAASLHPTTRRKVNWDGRTLGDWTRELEGADALINLAGRSVDCRYHARNRRLIMDSRVESTRILGQAIGRCAAPPRVWLNASTATIYQHTFGPAWDESGVIAGTPEAKDLFSVEVAQAWERELEFVATPRTRKVAMRMAMVLGEAKNSVLPVLRRLVRMRLGGRMGHGRQFVSWIHQNDLCRAIEWLLDREDLSGPVNLAAPGPVTNAEMMRLLRKVCGVRVGLPAAAWMLAVGAFFLRTETELVIKSRRVVPGKLLASQFRFHFPTMPEALDDLCKKMA